MIVYHGSNSNFKKLRISKSLVKHTSTELNEGLGIYFSTNREVASSYGKYIYTLEINDKLFRDFRKKAECIKYIMEYVKYIKANVGIDIRSYVNLNNIADYMYYGGISIANLSREISLLLDSCEKWYSKDVTETKRKKTITLLKKYNKESLYAYMFNYNIKDIGVIKVVDDNVVRIINKESAY